MTARAVARHPLTHFLALGAALFALRVLLRPHPLNTDVTVSRARVESLVAAQPNASHADIRARVDHLIDEDLLLLEARRLGLDRDDPSVRQRLVQKAELALLPASAFTTPTESELRAYWSAHPEQFPSPARMDLEHIYFAPNATTEQRARDALTALRNGAQPDALGDAFSLGRSLPSRTDEQLAIDMGEPFARAVLAVTHTDWFGPVRSRYGVHLVRITARTPAEVIPFDLARGRVRDAFVESRHVQARRTLLDRLRREHTVHVEWPAGWP